MTLFDTDKARDTKVEALQRRMMEGIGDGWTDVLRNADDILYGISEQLLTKKEVICPASGDVFNAFRECKFSNLKVVFVLQDPYHQVWPGGTRVADGLAMSCSKTGMIQPSLKLVYDEIERTVGYTERNPDLRPWAHQGILLMNTALTVAQGRPDSHTELWLPFTQYILREMSRRFNNMLYVFFGAKAKSFSNFVTNGTKYTTIHPAAAAYRGGHWDSDGLFNNINKELHRKGLEEIRW